MRPHVHASPCKHIILRFTASMFSKPGMSVDAWGVLQQAKGFLFSSGTFGCQIRAHLLAISPPILISIVGGGAYHAAIMLNFSKKTYVINYIQLKGKIVVNYLKFFCQFGYEELYLTNPANPSFNRFWACSFAIFRILELQMRLGAFGFFFLLSAMTIFSSLLHWPGFKSPPVLLGLTDEPCLKGGPSPLLSSSSFWSSDFPL